MKYCTHLLAAAGMITAAICATAQYNDEKVFRGATEVACPVDFKKRSEQSDIH